jgi:hypothetical protein
MVYGPAWRCVGTLREIKYVDDGLPGDEDVHGQTVQDA